MATDTLDIPVQVKSLAAELGAKGFPEWQQRLSEAVDAASTGTELVMASRWHLKEMLQQERGLPFDLKTKAHFLIEAINQLGV